MFHLTSISAAQWLILKKKTILWCCYYDTVPWNENLICCDNWENCELSNKINGFWVQSIHKMTLLYFHQACLKHAYSHYNQQACIQKL